MNINNTLNYYSSGTKLVTYNQYTWATTSGAGTYIHFKTDIGLYTYVMTRVEAVGINYANAAPIRCVWGWYTYNYLIDRGLENIYSGLTAHGIYMSSDGYVVFRGYASSLGDSSLMLNMVHANPAGYGATVNITAANQNNTSGNYY